MSSYLSCNQALVALLDGQTIKNKKMTIKKIEEYKDIKIAIYQSSNKSDVSYFSLIEFLEKYQNEKTEFLLSEDALVEWFRPKIVWYKKSDRIVDLRASKFQYFHRSKDINNWNFPCADDVAVLEWDIGLYPVTWELAKRRSRYV